MYFKKIFLYACTGKILKKYALVILERGLGQVKGYMDGRWAIIICTLIPE